ncbi:hypothetical protein LC612_41165 [Nostoc sp. CHAB 5834]|nr:hypothetical protein [Nostoc sp. CHAB 5834]
MTTLQLIWKSKDSDLLRDLAKYRQAIEDNQFPDMITIWRETVAMIEHEIDQRTLLAGSASWRVPALLDQTPF